MDGGDEGFLGSRINEHEVIVEKVIAE